MPKEDSWHPLREVIGVPGRYQNFEIKSETSKHLPEFSFYMVIKHSGVSSTLPTTSVVYSYSRTIQKRDV